MKLTLIAIFAALALMIGSFVRFVATWDKSIEQPVFGLHDLAIERGVS